MNSPKASRWTWAAAAWVLFIFFSSTSLAKDLSEITFGFFSKILFAGMDSQTSAYSLIHLLADKGFHVGMFCVLAILLWQALPDRAHKVWIILLAGAIVGSCSELLQSFFPDRDPAIRDVLINIGGTALGITFCYLFAKHQSRNPTVTAT